MQNVRERMDICFDSRGASAVTEVDTYKNGYVEIKKQEEAKINLHRNYER